MNLFYDSFEAKFTAVLALAGTNLIFSLSRERHTTRVVHLYIYAEH